MKSKDTILLEQTYLKVHTRSKSLTEDLGYGPDEDPMNTQETPDSDFSISNELRSLHTNLVPGTKTRSGALVAEVLLDLIKALEEKDKKQTDGA